jgi:hypothetical protein
MNASGTLFKRCGRDIPMWRLEEIDESGEAKGHRMAQISTQILPVEILGSIFWLPTSTDYP